VIVSNGVAYVIDCGEAVTEAMWLGAARRHFRGAVIVGEDLLEI
jgi:hypothetical protein